MTMRKPFGRIFCSIATCGAFKLSSRKTGQSFLLSCGSLQFVQLRNRLVRIAGKNARGETVQILVGARILRGNPAKRGEVRGDDAVILASQRAGPGSTGTDPFKIIKHLAG